MKQPTFRAEMSIDDKTGRLVAAYLRVREGDVQETREVLEGVVYADYDAQGSLLGVELLGACPSSVLAQLAARQPEEVKQFLTGSVPCELLPAPREVI